ncbi:MAG: CRTAC1 family protein [Runella sp.]
MRLLNKSYKIKIALLVIFIFAQSGQFLHTQTLPKPVAFIDVTKEAGIRHQFRVFEGMFGGGACVFDYDNDGWEDLYVTGGMSRDVFYRNNHDGTFTDIHSQAGFTTVTERYVTQGVAAADVNRDGWVDLFITTITTKGKKQPVPRAPNLLFLNNGNGTFRDATKDFRLDQLSSFSTGVSFGDINYDGYPDLYIGNYFNDYQGDLTYINDATIVSATQTSKGYLLLNRKGQYFEDVYEDFGLTHKGFGFGGVFSDYDNDGDQDLLINHDFGYKRTPNLLLEYHRGTFEDVAPQLKMDLPINSMGTAVGDINNDGIMEYYFTNIRFNRLMVRHNIKAPYEDLTKERGMTFVSISWGANFADFDHDGDVDLFVANGDLNPNCVPLADFYFENDGKGFFQDKAYAVGLNDYGVGRGSVVFDYDNDGDLDLLVVNQQPVLSYPVESVTRLYRNDTAKGNWLKIKLKGISSELNGLGARVEVRAGGKKFVREVDGGGSSHISQNSTILHFGLADATAADSIVVTWPGGNTQILTQQKVNQVLTIIETPENKTLSVIGWMIAGILMVFVVLWLFKKKLFPKNILKG